jgi:coatomer subunit beta'
MLHGSMVCVATGLLYPRPWPAHARLDPLQKKFTQRSERVKMVDLHPTEPWVLSALYNGQVQVWNYQTQTLVKSFEITDQPVRCARFIARKQWLVTGSDDMQIRVFNYNTNEKVAQFEGHQDYIRYLEIHPSQPYMLSTSDDMTIKMWDWERGWAHVKTFEGHAHYVMMARFNPKDSNTFATASLDHSIKVWSLNSTTPNFSLEGHRNGVNCLDYYPGGDKPYIVSGADDSSVKVWDY